MKTNKSDAGYLLGAILVILAAGYIAELALTEAPETNKPVDEKETDATDIKNAGPQMDEQLNHVA